MLNPPQLCPSSSLAKPRGADRIIESRKLEMNFKVIKSNRYLRIAKATTKP